ncbi:MAG: hypothetical protein ABI186_03605 [Candidatus Elarobacter sp.]
MASSSQVTVAGTSTASSLPVYPGATKKEIHMHGPLTVCGSKMSMTLYDAKAAAPAAVANWYKDHIAGAILVDVSPDTSSTAYSVFEPGGAASAAITKVNFAPALSKAAKSLGADTTSLGLVTYVPPLSHDVIALFENAARGGASAKQAAREQLKAKCNDIAG